MLTCYDRSKSQHNGGVVVRTLIALILLLPSAAVLADAPSHEVWHAVATPPRPGLPVVTIELGYPGPYISPVASPITLRATAGDLPFDGYIGFHFALRNARTFNIPVASRAILKPHASWSFSTKAELHYFGELKREIVVDWLNPSVDVIATQNAGVPPWSSRSGRLHVIRRAETYSPISGDDAWEHADALPDIAWWYRGFRALLVPLDVWLDLSPRTREAIFVSGTRVVFSGLPAPSQRMDAIDRALIPVVFDSRPGSYQVPWPYRPTVSAPVPVPLSWKARPGAVWTGSASMPYIVSNQIATWVADENALTGPLPAMDPSPIRRDQPLGPKGIRGRFPGVRDILQSFFPFVAMIFIAVASLALWPLMRRSPGLPLALTAVALSAAILLGRNRIRPIGNASAGGGDATHASFTYDNRSPLAPGVLDHYSLERIYGTTPLPPKPASAETRRTAVTTADRNGAGSTEIRDSATVAGWGTIVRQRTWGVASRFSERRELGDVPVVHVRQRDGHKLVLDYESPFPVDRIGAEWVYDNTQYFGAVATDGSTRGTATIENRITLWSPALAGWDAPYSSQVEEGRGRSSTRVSFVEKRRNGIRMIEWTDPFPAPDQKPASFLMNAELIDDADAGKSHVFALPVALIGPEATALISVPKALGEIEVTVSYATGSVRAIPTGRDGIPYLTAAYAIPQEAFHQIVQEGGMLRVSLKPARTDAAHLSMTFPQLISTEQVFIEVWEKP
jgi:hypothetical protein